MPDGNPREKAPCVGDSSGWTSASLKILMDERRIHDKELGEERDRRYAEVNVEKEKALKIKEEADKAALALAREIQTYKDEKANELREQINSERGLYASKADLSSLAEKIEAQLKPLAEYVSSNQGKVSGVASSWAMLFATFGAVGVIAAVVAAWAWIASIAKH